MNWPTIKALVSKDYTLFFRNRFFTIVTVLGIVFYLIIYFVMPKAVDESLDIGLYAPVPLPAFGEISEEGLEIKIVDSEEALKEAVIEGEVVAGIELPADIIESLMSGQKPRVSLYFASDIPQETKDAVTVLIKELAYQQTGQSMDIQVSEEILGTDMMGMQIPPRNRMRPLLAVILIIFETMGLANLISQEVERRTVQALLVTPMTVKDLFAAKGIVGISLAFGQAVFFMAIVGGLNQQPVLILLALLLGAVLATGVGFLIASLGKDFMSIMAWGIVIFIVLVIPGFTVMFPGAATGWVKIIPSYYLVDTVHRVTNFGAGWGDMWANLLILLGFDIVIFWAGILAMRRKTG